MTRTSDPDRKQVRTSRLAGRTQYPGTPRWVYAFGGIVIVLLLVFVIRHLASGGGVAHHMMPS